MPVASRKLTTIPSHTSILSIQTVGAMLPPCRANARATIIAGSIIRLFTGRCGCGSAHPQSCWHHAAPLPSKSARNHFIAGSIIRRFDHGR